MAGQTARLTCPHGDACGACALLGIDYPEQLRRKRDVLARALAARPGLADVPVPERLPSPRTAGYRNRVKMAVGLSRHGGASVGYFREGTREIVDAPDCRVLVPELLDTTRRLRAWLDRARDVPRTLRHVDVRCGDDPGRQHLILVFRSETVPPFPLEAIRRTCPAVDGVSANANPSAGPQVLRGPIRHAWGRREVWVDHAGLRLRVSPGSFFQVNLAVLPAIHARLAEFLDGGGTLVDLYAGVGTHALALRERFRRVVCVEGARPAVADLRDTLARHRIERVEVVGRSVERSLAEWDAWRPDAVVLNPSRAGARESVLAAIAASPANKVAYLSCEPTTLARDLEALRAGGFETRSVLPIDMMPQTRQVEALALLHRAPRPAARGRGPRRASARVSSRRRS